MTQLWTRAATIAAAAAALAACQTAPSYPVREGYTPAPPLTPQYPTRQDAPATPPAPATDESAAPPPAAGAVPHAAVESTPLAPMAMSATDSSASQASAAVADPPPAPPAADPPPSANTDPPPEPAYQPPPRPEPRPRPAPVPTRLAATGHVIAVNGQMQTYTVRPGDHVDALARQFDTSRHQIVEDNDLVEPYRLHPGQHLRLPAPPATAYVAAAGDTLSVVARRFSIRVDRLRSMNRSAPSTLRAGQRLILPEDTRDIGPQRVPAPELAARMPRPRTEPRLADNPPRPAYPPPAYTPAPYNPPPPAALASNDATPPGPPSHVDSSPPSAPAPVPALIPYTRPTPPSATLAAANRGALEHAPSAASPPDLPRATPSPALARPTPIPPPPRPAYTPPAYSPPAYTPPSAPAIAHAPPSVPNAPPVADAQIANLGHGRFLWPIQGAIISTFGPKAGGRRNDGVDIRGTDGTSVRAAAGGEVVYAGDQVPGFGNLVLLKHPDGWVTAYAHLGRVSVTMRQRVTQGQEIGTVGSSGGAPEPQLHFEIRYAPTPADRARPIDPALVLPTTR